jgi:transcriptional regulator with XRE-family HTH domain
MTTLAVALYGHFGHIPGMPSKPLAEPPNRIETLRKSLGWSMEKLAAECDPPTSAAQISRLEKGQRKLTDFWMERIARALGCEPSELLKGAPAPLSPDERALVELYRGLEEPGQAALFQAGSAMRKRSSDKG